MSFQEDIDSSFPVCGKRTRSAVIRKKVAQRSVNHLKGTPDADGAFRHFVKKSGFALVDLQSVGIRDVLVVSVKIKNQVLILSRWSLPLFSPSDVGNFPLLYKRDTRSYTSTQFAAITIIL